jgi:aminotransferase
MIVIFLIIYVLLISYCVLLYVASGRNRIPVLPSGGIVKKNYDIYSGAMRLKKVEPSPIRVILDKAAAMKAQGLPVIPFSAGEPDFNTPTDIKSSTIEAINSNYSHYTSNRGYPALRDLLAAYIKEETQTVYDPSSEILVTSSAAEALNNTIMTFVDEGDEVIIFTPAFVSYKCLTNLCGGTFIDIPLKPENRFQIDIEAVKAKISGRTKMLILNNPSNPTGAVLDRETLDALCKLSIERNFLILADEIYSRLTYDGATFHSIASFPGMKERSIIISGFSKTFAMTGWRLGYIATDARLATLILKTHQYSTTCSPTFIQVGLVHGMNTEQTKREVQAMVKAFGKRRALILSGLDRIKKLSYIKPFGAFYVMVDVSKTGMTGVEFSKKLLEEKYVATVPAVGLGSACGDYIRISYATSDENIVEGLKRLGELVDAL